MKLLTDRVNIADFFKKVPLGSILMLDYDGTLAPFVKERMLAHPYPGVKERLFALMEMENTRTVIVSGRSLSDLEMLLGMPLQLELWGSHGLERKLPSGKKIYAPIDAKLRDGLNQGIQVCQENTDREYCEIKPYSVAFHCRGMNQELQSHKLKQIEHLWNKICAHYDLAINHFDGGIELRPKGGNKGDVVQEVLSEMQKKCAIAYLGDDLTDEDAFASLGDKGLKVLVREHFRPTLADIHLIPPEELLAFLDKWRGA